MKRILYTTGFLLSALIAAILVVPSFIDWTDYRDAFEQRLENATGRDVSIDGAVAMTVLPRPALSIEGVRLGSVPGATSADFLAAESISVNLAVAPLLTGRVQFSSIVVTRPVIFAEVLPDGRATWQFRVATAEGPQSASGTSASIDFGVDRLIVEEGTIRYRDDAGGIAQDIDGLSVEIKARDLAGPFDVRANASAFATSWELAVTLGAVTPDRPSSLTIKVDAPDAGVSAELAGTFFTSGEGPLVSGKGTIRADRLDLALQTAGIGAELSEVPPALRNALTISGAVELTAEGVRSDRVELSLGELSVSGMMSYDWVLEPRFAVSLNIGRADIDGWIEGRTASGIKYAEAISLISVRTARAQEPMTPGFTLPDHVSGSFDITAELLEWRGQILRNARIAANLADGEITVADFSVELPGNTSVAANGFIRAESGGPAFDLDARLDSQNFRSLLAWWDIEPPADVIPPGRLNAFSVDGRITGSPALIELSGIAAALDSTSVSGFVSYRAGTPARLRLDLTANSLDADSYLPALLSGEGAGSGFAGQQAMKAGSGDGEGQARAQALYVDATIAIQKLTLGGYVVENIILDAAASGSDIQISRLSASDLAGLSFEANGAIKNVNVSPRLENVRIKGRTSDPVKVARALEIDLPRIPVFTSDLTIDATVSGNQREANVSAQIAFGDLVADLAGAVSADALSYEGRAALRHSDYGAFVRGLAFVYPESVPSPGALAVSGAMQIEPGKISVSAFEARTGDNAAAGAFTSRSSDDGLSVSGQLAIEKADLDILFPVDPTDALRQSSRSRSGQGADQVSQRWSAEPFPVSMFEGISATLDVSAGDVRGRGFHIEQLKAPFIVANDTLTVTGWTGKVFGGQGSGELKVVSGADLGVAALVDIKDADLALVRFQANSGSAASGRVTLQAAISGRGATQRALVSSLEGRGIFAARGIDAGRVNSSGLVGGLVAPVRALSQLGGLLSGGVTKGLANMNASFAGAQGMFALSDATVQSNVYSGEFEGFIDVARWWIDVEGRVRLEANLITQLLGNRIQMPSLIPVTVSGPLDSPNVKTNAAEPQTQQQPAQQVTPSDAASAPPPQPSEPNPVDLFRGILNELAEPK
jgi:uncharacterized protein involved in outer membrane biogenesis